MDERHCETCVCGCTCGFGGEHVEDNPRCALTPCEQPEWEYGVKWGDEPDDSRPTLCDSREHAERRVAASHGDKVVRRTPARTIPAGEWEEMPDE